ncbi:MAG: VWA domain-containing protein, partial [Verrucomicrobiales bacterium]|nr:VWA domain-containing protein [Verrucomicrobiales bacterium]
MRLTAPEWLLLLPLLAAAGWFWPGLGLRRPLRALLLLMAVVLAAGPEWRRFGDGLDLWVLVDHSDSARELLAPQQAEWETLLRRSQGSADRLRFVDFAGETVTRGARLRSGAEGVQYAGPTDSTRLRSALLHVLAEVDENRSSRLLVWTDGQSTEPLEGMAERLGRQEVPLDYRRAVRAGARDWRITDLILPQRVQPGQAFLLEAWVAGDEDGPVEVQVLQGGVEVARRPVEVVNGMGRLRLSARLTKPGAVEFQARVQQEGDALVGNNSAARWVEVTSGPRVVLITGYTNDPVASVLAAQGFEVETLADASRAQAGVLAGAKVVILNNVAASEMSVPFLKALDFYVNEQGGGLVMVGGQNSFGSGGYFGSALEPLLPVSMELKQEHRKLALALAIVMDRSGSMAATVAGSGATKMQLANEGAGRAVMLLGDSDYLTVLAVDSTPHVVAAPVQVGPNRDMLEDAVRRVQSAGGGIFVYSGLRGAWDELKRVPVGQRHIILFSDAADSEEPGDYKNLIAEMVKEKT